MNFKIIKLREASHENYSALFHMNEIQAQTKLIYSRNNSGCLLRVAVSADGEGA